MSTQPKVTVLTPTFNRAEYLAECLDSILAQTLPAAQIIVVNDGSTDHTLEVLQPYWKKIDYMETGQVGKPSAINSGLKKVKGDYLWIFDDDDVAFDFALERFVEPLEKYPEYGFSYSTYYLAETNPDDHRIGKIRSESIIPDLETKGFLVPLLEANFLGGAALFARTACYAKVGAFDPQLLRSQDYEMAIRIARHFKGIRVQGGATFYYRQHSGLRGPTGDRFESGLKKGKWWKYGQQFFRRLYKELPLETYLPPGSSLEKLRRQALLQRMGVMASKLLFDEITKDLHALAQVNDPAPFTQLEKMIIEKFIIKVPYYNVGSLFDHLAFFDTVRQLSASSSLIRKLRTEIFGALLKRCWRRPSCSHIRGTIHRILRLYKT